MRGKYSWNSKLDGIQGVCVARTPLEISLAKLHYADTELLQVGQKRIEITYINEEADYYDVENTHQCDMRDYPEVCVGCIDTWFENGLAAQADNWRNE